MIAVIDDKITTRLSFIVPMFNVENFIEICIRSLFAQDIPQVQYEVIAIDDCSSDCSREIVLSLQKEYPTLKLIELSENSRQGTARNAGLSVAQGRYIWFVDSDDFIKPNVLNSLLNIIEKDDLDLVHFDYEIWNDGITSISSAQYELDICSGADLIFDKTVKWSLKCCTVCNWIVKRNFLLKNNFWFEEKVQYEDADYSIKVLAYAERIKHLNIAPYFYRQVNSSVTHTNVSINHVKYRILLALRYDDLFQKFIIDKRDVRFYPALKEVIEYETRLAFKDVCKFENCQKNEFVHFIKDCNLKPLRKHLCFLKYQSLTNRILWNERTDMWKAEKRWRGYKKSIKNVLNNIACKIFCSFLLI